MSPYFLSLRLFNYIQVLLDLRCLCLGFESLVGSTISLLFSYCTLSYTAKVGLHPQPWFIILTVFRIIL